MQLITHVKSVFKYWSAEYEKNTKLGSEYYRNYNNKSVLATE